MHNSRLCLAALLLMTAGLAANAQGPPVGNDQVYQVNYNGGSDSVTGLTFTFHDGSYAEGPGAGTWAVPFQVVGQAGQGTYEAWCIDIPNPQYNGDKINYDVTAVTASSQTYLPPVSPAEIQEASWLIDTYQPTITGNILALTGQSEINAAALQLALWEVVSGDPISQIGLNDVTSPHNPGFYVNSGNLAVEQLADVDLNNLGGYLAKGLGGGMGYLYTVDTTDPNHSGQNLLGFGGAPGNGGGGFQPTTPEGSTMAMFALGMAPLFGTFWSKRRNKTAKQASA